MVTSKSVVRLGRIGAFTGIYLHRMTRITSLGDVLEEHVVLLFQLNEGLDDGVEVLLLKVRSDPGHQGGEHDGILLGGYGVAPILPSPLLPFVRPELSTA